MLLKRERERERERGGGERERAQSRTRLAFQPDALIISCYRTLQYAISQHESVKMFITFGSVHYLTKAISGIVIYSGLMASTFTSKP